MNDYINFANCVLQTIANIRLPVSNNLNMGNIDPAKYQITAGAIRGFYEVEEIIRQVAKQWMNGSKVMPNKQAYIKLLNPKDPSSTDSQPMHLSKEAPEND